MLCNNLSGAILKWGIKELTEEESNWCKTQISKSNEISAYFPKIDKGLIISNDAFFNVRKTTENYKQGEKFSLS